MEMEEIIFVPANGRGRGEERVDAAGPVSSDSDYYLCEFVQIEYWGVGWSWVF